jgi:hypothetical protein
VLGQYAYEIAQQWIKETNTKYVADHPHGAQAKEEPHLEPAILVHPLGEAATGGFSEQGQPEGDRHYHEVSGDGCGDGGYCGGHWVRPAALRQRRLLTLINTPSP